MAKNKLIKNISTVMIYSLIAKFSSFLVELLVASNLGANAYTDAFYMVYGIVQIIYPMISVGIWKVFLPEYKTRRVLGDDEGAFNLTSRLITIFCLISLFLIVIINLFPAFVIGIFAPGFETETAEISSLLLRIYIFILLFNTISTFSSAILQSHNHFSKAQVKDILFHIPALLYLVIFRSDCDVTGLAIVNTFGALFSSVVSVVFRRSYYRFCFPARLFDDDVKRVLKLVPVACLNSIINQLNNVIDKVFASTLPTGSVTYLNYGSKLIHLFDGIFSTAISTALFPYITELVAKKEQEKLKRFLKNYIVLISMILLPITAIIIVYSNEIVQIVFGHGKFDQAAVNETALVLLMYGLGLLLMCLTTIINDIFYIIKRTKVLLWTTVANIVSNVILDFVFIRIWGVAGLALATTISLLIALTIKFIFIRDIFRIDVELIKHFCLIILYCAVSTAPVLYFNSVFAFSTLPNFVVGVVIFSVVYVTFAFILNKGMRDTFMASIKNFSRGGVNKNFKTTTLIEELKVDKENNSRKSYYVLFYYRMMHNAYLRKRKLSLKLWGVFKAITFFFMNINAQISYKADIGSDIRLPHSADGVVISAKAIIGNHQTIYHQVTIGINEGKLEDEQKIIIHDNCYLSVGCKVISCEVGDGCKIGPNAVVYRDLPGGTVYVASNQVIEK